MASPRIEYAVLPAGDDAGQDRCFTAEGLVVVLDGASAYDPTVSPEAGEYVDTLGPTLVEQIESHPGVDLREAVAEAISQTADKLNVVPGKGPSSTVSIVRCGARTVDILVLGDSPVVIHSTDGSEEIVVQHRMKHIAPELRQLYRERLANGNGYNEQHRALLREIQRREVSMRNRPGGYWIAEADPAAAVSATLVTRPLEVCARIVVYTDGVLTLGVEDLGLLAPLTASSAHDGDLEALLQVAQRWEEECDPQGVRRPRSKEHDDKTVAVITL
jgi:hypothetical protein